MARKRNESRSMMPVEGGAGPIQRHRTPRAKTAAPPAAEPGTSEPVNVEPRIEPGDSARAEVSFNPISERDEIARLAYSFWEARNGQGGSAEEDWIRAEQEYHRRRQAQAS